MCTSYAPPTPPVTHGVFSKEFCHSVGLPSCNDMWEKNKASWNVGLGGEGGQVQQGENLRA